MGTDQRGDGRVDGDDRDRAEPSDRSRSVRVVCVDDDTLIREGITRLLRDVSVVGAFRSVESFLAESPAADVVLLDLWLSGPHQDRVGDQGLTAPEFDQAATRRFLVTDDGGRGVHVEDGLGALGEAAQQPLL